MLIGSENGYEFHVPTSGGKAGRGANRTGSVQVRKGGQIVKQFRFYMEDKESRRAAIDKAKKYAKDEAGKGNVANLPCSTEPPAPPANNFKVECIPNPEVGPHGLLLLVTHNGMHWTQTSLLAEETPAVVTALQQAALHVRWPAVLASVNSGEKAPTPYGDAAEAFGVARSRYDCACRAMETMTGTMVMPDRERNDVRNEWQAAGVALSLLYDLLLTQLQNAKLLPDIPAL